MTKNDIVSVEKSKKVDLTELFGPEPAMMTCDICHKEKRDVRYADLIGKWICSDCMGVPEFSEDY